MADAEFEWELGYEKALRRARRWREELEDPEWRENILEDEDRKDAAWIRVYTIYETSEPEKTQVILGNCGAVDPTGYIEGGVVDLEYHYMMTPLELWYAFVEHVLTNFIPGPDSGVDNDTRRDLWESGVYHALCGELSESFSFRFCPIYDEDWKDPTQIPGGERKMGPGLISDFNNVNEGSGLNGLHPDPYDISFNDAPLECVFGWPEADEELIKSVALMRINHYGIVDKNLNAEANIISPIYRFRKKNSRSHCRGIHDPVLYDFWAVALDLKSIWSKGRSYVILSKTRSLALLQQCIAFAKRASSKDINYENHSEWKHSGILQGKRFVVHEGDSIAILCCDNMKMIVHGICFLERGGNSMQSLIQGINKLQITKTALKCFDSIPAFLESTEEYKDNNNSAGSDGKKGLGWKLWKRPKRGRIGK